MLFKYFCEVFNMYYIYLIYNSNIHVCVLFFLLQGWILEHLPGLYPRKKSKSWKSERPCARRWHIDVQHYCLLLDHLEVDDVRFCTYGDHREVRPFQFMCTYSGWLMCGKERVYRHLPERVKRQFEFVQDVPRHPSSVAHMPTQLLTIVLLDAQAWFYPHWVHRCQRP